MRDYPHAVDSPNFAAGQASPRFTVDSSAKLSPQDRLRLQCGVDHLVQLGSRATGEFLAELGHETHSTGVILDKLDAWRAGLSLEMLRAAGALTWPPHLVEVPGRTKR